jgi:hypothetical protein
VIAFSSCPAPCPLPSRSVSSQPWPASESTPPLRQPSGISCRHRTAAPQSPGAKERPDLHPRHQVMRSPGHRAAVRPPFPLPLPKAPRNSPCLRSWMRDGELFLSVVRNLSGRLRASPREFCFFERQSTNSELRWTSPRPGYHCDGHSGCRTSDGR